MGDARTVGSVAWKGTLAAGSDGCDLAGLLQAAMDALGAMDLEALEVLNAEVEVIAKQQVRLRSAKMGEAVMLRGALGELLVSTERSLRMLRGLQRGGSQRFEGGRTWEH